MKVGMADRIGVGIVDDDFWQADVNVMLTFVAEGRYCNVVGSVLWLCHAYSPLVVLHVSKIVSVSKRY